MTDQKEERGVTRKRFMLWQTVMLTRRYGKPKEAVITKVGRLYATVGEGFTSDQFRLDTGAQKNGYGRIYTLDEWAERERIAEITAELRAHNIGPRRTGHFTQPLATLEAILAVLQGQEDAS